MASQAERPLQMNAADVRRALKGFYPHPEYGILFEVAQGTGAAAGRHLDAMAMGVWPSRGLFLNGIEIKVSRSDFRREVTQPQKAEALAKYCNFFWIAAPRGIVPIEELPPKWGLLEVGADYKIKQAKPADRHSPEPPSLNLIAALFRAAMRPGDADDIAAAVAAEKLKLEAMVDKRVQDGVAARRVQAEGDAEQWRRVKAVFGEEGDRYLNDARLVAAVKAVLKSGVAETYRGLRSLQGTLKSALDGVNGAMETFPAEPE